MTKSILTQKVNIVYLPTFSPTYIPWFHVEEVLFTNTVMQRSSFSKKKSAHLSENMKHN